MLLTRKKVSLKKESTRNMSGRPVIAVDVDEVLADFIPTLALYHNEMWGSNLSSASFHSYEFHHVWGGTFEECNVKMLQFFETTHLDQLSPVKGALEALQWLKDETGAELHIVTSRQHAIADRTRYWIDTHFPGIFKEVHFGNHYSSSGQKRSKPEMCQDIGALVIIDDSQKYAGHCAEAGIPCVLFGDYAWNRDEEMAGGVVWTSKVEEHVAALVTKVGTDWDIAAKTLKRIVIDEYKKKFYRRKLPLIAAIQMCATADKNSNIRKLNRLVRQAATLGATLISLPEACLCIGGDHSARAEALDGRSVGYLRAMAKELGIYLNVGGVALVQEGEDVAESKKLRNSALLIDPEGMLVSVYDKIHLFDNPYTQMWESEYTVTGDPSQVVTAVVAPAGKGEAGELEWCQYKLGLTICYDLRFPAMYSRLREQHCDVCTVPSAFMQRTGEAHWEVLLRARAIETQMYVTATA